MHKLNACLTTEDLIPSLNTLTHLYPLLTPHEPASLLDKFLHFSVQHELQLLLPVMGITEVQHLALSDVLPVPQMPPWILGLHHRQGEILWILDLGHALGYPSEFQAGHLFMKSMLIVIDVDGKRLGLAVSSVHDIDLYDPNWFKAPFPASMPPQLARVAAGYEPQSGLVLLDPKHLVQEETLIPRSP